MVGPAASILNNVIGPVLATDTLPAASNSLETERQRRQAQPTEVLQLSMLDRAPGYRETVKVNKQVLQTGVFGAATQRGIQKNESKVPTGFSLDIVA